MAAHPDAPAVDSGQEMLTYSELAEAASGVAEQLAELGIGPGDKVGVRIRSGSTDLYVAIIGIMNTNMSEKGLRVIENMKPPMRSGANIMKIGKNWGLGSFGGVGAFSGR